MNHSLNMSQCNYLTAIVMEQKRLCVGQQIVKATILFQKDTIQNWCIIPMQVNIATFLH